MPNPFVIDPISGRTSSYEELGRLLLDHTLRYRPLCRPTGLADLFENLASALAANGDITLVDADFTSSELHRLGIEEPGLEAVRELPRERKAGTLVELLDDIRGSCTSRITLFTSGSTGLPRRVSHPLPNLCRSLRVGVEHSTDVWGFAYNPTHIAGVQVFLQALFNLNPLVNLFGLPGDAVLDLARRHHITHISATPSFYRLLLPVDDSLPEVSVITLGGESTDAALLDRLHSLFPNARFKNIYASTEAGALLSAENDLFGIPPEMGEVIRLRDGRLELHCSLLGNLDARASFNGDWYSTGDVVEVVRENPLRFRIVSRDRDWVNVGGNKVNPAEAENALLAHPCVREARVTGRPNPVLGNVLVAEIVPFKTAPSEAELRIFLGERLQPFKIPRVIRMVTSIDKTRTGKVKRDE